MRAPPRSLQGGNNNIFKVSAIPSSPPIVNPENKARAQTPIDLICYRFFYEITLAFPPRTRYKSAILDRGTQSCSWYLRPDLNLLPGLHQLCETRPTLPRRRHAPLDRWDWDSAHKAILFAPWKGQFEWVEEPQASPDGETVAAIVKTGDAQFNVCANGAIWETPFEKIWHLRFAPDGRLTAIVSDSGEWTLAVDGVPWENRFGQVWEPRFSADGTSIAVKFQQDMRYGMAVNDAPWATTFANMTCATLSADGRRSAAAVQVENFGEADIAAFQKGAFSAALDGQPWDRRFVNVWNMVISPDGRKLAAEVRLTLYDYTIAVNGQPWERTFNCVWEPVFDPRDGSVLTLFRQAGQWTLVRDGSPAWERRFVQLWHPVFSPDGANLAAIVAP